jgi:hypothetical protein
MSEPKAVHETATTYEAGIQFLDQAQLEQLNRFLAKAAQADYAEVTLIVRCGKPRHIQITIGEDMQKRMVAK